MAINELNVYIQNILLKKDNKRGVKFYENY